MWRRLLYWNFRLVYTAGLWTRDRCTPMGGLLLGGMIGSGIFSVDTRQSLAFQIFTYLAALLCLSLASLFTFKARFRVRRVLPEYATVRQPVKYKIIVENLGRVSQKDILLFDELNAGLPGFDEFAAASDPKDRGRNWFDRIVGYPRLLNLMQTKRGASIEPVTIHSLPAKDADEIAVELYPVRRGYLRFARTRIARPDPLGLIRAMRSCQHEDALLVLPRTYTVPPVQLRGKRKYQHGGMNQASTVGDAQEFMSLRDYKPGDPLRAIHWRSYAKSGHPVVKEFQDEFFVRQGLLLDTFIENCPDAVFEEAVSVAASFIVVDQPRDALLDLMFVGTESYRYTSGRSLSQVENMLEILACVEPCRQPAFSRLIELVLRHANETSGVICILLAWDEKRQNLVRQLTARNIPVLVLVITDRPDAQVSDVSALGLDADHFRRLHTNNMQLQLDQLCRI
jgi:uncharacterized protein (DUF58 family)